VHLERPSGERCLQGSRAQGGLPSGEARIEEMTIDVSQELDVKIKKDVIPD
jgi:hypothetical protein